MQVGLRSWLRNADPRIFSRRESKRMPLADLLARMDDYDWNSVEDITVTDRQRREKLRYFNSVLDCCGISLSGSVLDLACGPVSLGCSYKDAVGVDINAQYIKALRRNNQKGVIADIYSLPFEERSFDYVVAIDPPLTPIMLNRDGDGTVHFSIDPKAITRLVEEALKTARKNVLMVSYVIARSAPHPEMIEKRILEPLGYVIYRANGEVK